MDDTVFRSRSRFLLGLFGLVFFLVFWRLVWLQLVQGSKFRNQAQERYTASTGKTNERGTIYFSPRTGRLLTAASMQPVYALAVVPKEVLHKEELWNGLISIVPTIDRAKFDSALAKKDDPYEVLVKEISSEQKKQILALKLDKLRFTEQKERYYPGGTLAAHVLGFVAFKGDNLTGQYGLEKQYNDVLERSFTNLYTNFFAQLFSDVGKTLKKNGDDKKEASLITSIEPEVQLRAQQELVELGAKWTPKEIGIIVMDPKTGEIVAMASSPTFDVNNFSKVESGEVYANPLVQHQYEMGSVVKPLIAAFALEKGVITPTTTYTDNGFVKVYDRTIYNFDKKARGPNTTMQMVLTQSLNTGMVFMMQKLKYSEVRDYLVSLGLGEKTGIDLPYEAKGFAENITHLRDVEYANIAFGQGIAWTPIQLTRALSTLANHGKIVTPHIVRAFDYGDGFVEQAEYPEAKSVLDPNTVETVSRMLVSAADTNFGKRSDIFKHYSIATKTGTAQVAGGGGYSDRRLHSFFGYFPAYDPQFVVFMYMLYPNGAKYSAETLSTPFINMSEFLINYYNIAPDRGIVVQ